MENVQEKENKSVKKTFTGVVTSDKMQKTVVVEVARRVKHPKFGKYQTRKARYKAHCENNDVHVGDVVTIVETRPLSKEKRWKVQTLVERARS